MSLYVLILFVHIAAAVLLLSTSVVGEPLVRAAVRRAASRQDVRAFLEISRPMARLSPIAALLILASGAYLSTAGRVWTLGWIQVSAVLWILNAVVAVSVVRPVVVRLEAETGAGGDTLVSPGMEQLRWASGWSWGQDLLATNDAVVLLLMTLRPALGISILLTLLANTAVVAGRQAFGLRQPRIAAAGLHPES